jgi:dephospho-CoA kinase
MILGITGGTGSGKTTLLKTAESLGFQVLDCDRIYHELLETDPALLHAIEARFPGTVEGGRLQRKKLGSIVFADPAALSDLNAITQATIRREVEARLASGRDTAIDAIALFESGLADLCDVTVAVTAPPEQRLRRLMARDGITEEYARSRIQAQPPEAYFRERCAHVLENTGDEAEFQRKCLAFFLRLGIMKKKPEEELP